MQKYLVRACLLLGTSLVCVYICFVLAEQVYFDKLLYKKSPWHGYVNDISMVALEQHHPIVDWILYPRVEDLKRLLLSEELQRTQFPEHDQEFVIAVIGDSTSNGVGVRVRQRYADILEYKLNNIRPTTIYNFSQPGDNIVDHFVKFELSEKYLKPDLVIFALYYNDLMDLDGSRYPSNLEKLNELSANCSPLFSHEKSGEQQLDEKEFLEAYVFPTYQEDYGNVCVCIDHF